MLGGSGEAARRLRARSFGFALRPRRVLPLCSLSGTVWEVNSGLVFGPRRAALSGLEPAPCLWPLFALLDAPGSLTPCAHGGPSAFRAGTGGGRQRRPRDNLPYRNAYPIPVILVLI